MKFLRFSAVLMLVFGAFFNTAFAAPIEIKLTINPVMCNSYDESGQCLDYAYGTQKLYVDGNDVYYVNDDDERVFLTPGPNGATIDAPNRYFEVTFKQNCPVNQGAPDITKFAKWAFFGYYKDTGCGEDGANCTPYINGDLSDISADRITDEGLAAARGYNANAEWIGLWEEDGRYGHFVTFPTTDGENPDVPCPGYTFDGWFDANDTKVEYNTDTDSDGVPDGYVPDPERSETLYAKWNQVGGCPCTQVVFDYNGGELDDGASQVVLYVNDNGFFTDSSCENPVGVDTTLQASKKGEKCKASGYKIQGGPDSYVTDETFKIIVPEAVQNHLASCPKSVTLVADYKNCPYRIICKDPVNNSTDYDLVTSDENEAVYGETIQITNQTLEKQCSGECEKPFNQNGWEVWANDVLQDPSPVTLPLDIIYGTAYNGALVIEFKPHCVVYSVKYKCAINDPEPIITRQIDTKQIYTVLDFKDSGCVLPEGAVFNGWKLSLPGTDLDGKVYSKNETSFIDNWPDADGTFTAQYTCDTDYENTGTEDNPVCAPKSAEDIIITLKADGKRTTCPTWWTVVDPTDIGGNNKCVCLDWDGPTLNSNGSNCNKYVFTGSTELIVHNTSNPVTITYDDQNGGQTLISTGEGSLWMPQRFLVVRYNMNCPSGQPGDAPGDAQAKWGYKAYYGDSGYSTDPYTYAHSTETNGNTRLSSEGQSRALGYLESATWYLKWDLGYAPIQLPDDNITCAGYVFDYWSESDDNNASPVQQCNYHTTEESTQYGYLPSKCVSQFTNPNAQSCTATTNYASDDCTDTTLYAHWTPGVFEVKLNAPDATVQGLVGFIYERYRDGWARNQNSTNWTQITLSGSELPSRTGYTLLGYGRNGQEGVDIVAAVNQDGSWTTPAADTVISNENWYARWAEAQSTTYTVTYNCGAQGSNTTGFTNSNTATVGEPYNVAYSNGEKIADCTPNPGYVFDKWLFNYDSNTYSSGYTIQQFPDVSTTPSFTATYTCAEGYTNSGTPENPVCEEQNNTVTFHFICRPNDFILTSAMGLLNISTNTENYLNQIYTDVDYDYSSDLSADNTFTAPMLLNNNGEYTCDLTQAVKETGWFDSPFSWHMGGSNYWEISLNDVTGHDYTVSYTPSSVAPNTSTASNPNMTYRQLADNENYTFKSRYYQRSGSARYKCKGSDGNPTQGDPNYDHVSVTNRNSYVVKGVGTNEGQINCSKPSQNATFQGWRATQNVRQNDPNNVESYLTTNNQNLNNVNPNENDGLFVAGSLVGQHGITAFPPREVYFVAVWNCADGYSYDIESGECVQCSGTQFYNATTHECTNCPPAYPNAEPWATSINQCYNNCQDNCLSQGCPDGATCMYNVVQVNGTMYHPNTACNITTLCEYTIGGCPPGQYINGETCGQCPAGFTSNPGATSITDCYKQCDVNCENTGQCEEALSNDPHALSGSCEYTSSTVSGVQYCANANCSETTSCSATNEQCAWTYDCAFIYHHNPQHGNLCEACEEGYYWNATAEQCESCNSTIRAQGQPYSLYSWTSHPPYNWDMQQCYRLCDNVTCVTTNAPEYTVPFLNNPSGQVSFYGNETDDIKVCDSQPYVEYCPHGMIGLGSIIGSLAVKPLAHRVDFHAGVNGDNNLGSFYIIGHERNHTTYGWSQIVGPAQTIGSVEHNVQYVNITYPVFLAPEATPVSGMDFAGYGYPQSNGTRYIDAGRDLTIDNAARILSGVNVNQSDARDLYAMYSSKPDFVINLLYDYGDGDPNHYESESVTTTYNKLYTTNNVGVYRDADRTQQMTTNGNNIEVTRKYVTVTLDANGGTVNGWNGQQPGEIVESDFYMDFSGFFNADDGIKQYITPQGFITAAGIAAGKGYTDDANWFARWRGVSVPLPIPTYDGYGFDGWYGQNWSAPAGPSINPNDDIKLTARWTKCNENKIVINGQCVQCNCTEDTGVVEGSCTTLVSGNSCNATAQCENNYGGLSVSCNGENCTVSCSPCDAAANQISINSQCVTCNCTPGTGAHCGDFSASNNQCNWGMGCNEGYVHLMPNCSGQGNSNCAPTCEPCQSGYISQNNECVPCEPESYQNGNVCDPCPDGQTSGEGATECYPITSHAIYDCGQGNGTPPHHPDGEPMTYGALHTVAGSGRCQREGYIFAGWNFDGDNGYHAQGESITWNYTTDKHFSAVYCPQCAETDHCIMTVSAPGQCQKTCEIGYDMVDGICIPKTYTGGITYLPNGGTPNEDFTQTVTFDAEFTTKGAVYSKARNVLDWWNVVSGGVGTFSGRAELNTTYTYQTDGATTLAAKWTPCNPGYISQNNECVPCGEDTYQIDDNCEPCSEGQTSPAGATECEPVKTYAKYTCGNGASGAAPADELMSYGASHTVKQNNGNAGERGCWKENNIFVGWIFEANNMFYEPGNTVAWNYTTDQTFAARYCPECPAIDHGTNQFSFESGQCHCTQVCDYGYEPVGGICKPKTNLVLTYKSNGGVPNQTFQRIYAFDQSFTTLGFADVRYVKSESIMTHWELESDVGRETFNGGVAEFNTNYTYRTDGNINLLAHWEQCSCAYGVGVALCNRPSIVNNACNFTAECEPGYIKPLVECNGASCVAQCKQCPAGTISVENECVSCKCEPKPDGGAASCGTLSIENNTCGWGPTCRPGYHNPISNCTGTGNIDCKPYCEMCGEGTYGTDGLSCTACPDGYTAPAGSTSIEDCYSHPIQYTINYQSNNGLHQTYNQNVYYNDAFTTATKTGTGFTRAGYVIDHWDVVSGGTNTFTDYDSDSHLYYANPGRNYAHYIDVVNTTLRAKWKICPEGTYEFGDVCRDCPDNYTSYEGAASIDECFLYHCDDGYHIEHGECVDNEKACVVPNAPNATGGKRFWNDELKAYGPCITVECDYGYHISGNACVKNNETCTVTNGHGEHMWDESTNQWGTCYVTNCDPGYYESGNACVECENRRVNGEIAVSGYVYGCEIATCMYQGQKYTLEGNECVPICTSDRFNEDPNNPTGTIRWDDNTKRCIRTCNPGYKMW